jgi:hypothetical protein
VRLTSRGPALRGQRPTITALAAFLGALAGGALLGGALVALLRPPRSAPPSLSLAPPPSCSLATASAQPPAPPPPPEPALPDDALARAAAGDLDALKRLESTPERARTLDEAMALARGHGALAGRDLQSLARALAEDPALAHDRTTLARLHDFIEREPVAFDALALVARLPGPESADLLHSVSRRHHRAPRGLLARDLVHGRAAREQASPELLLALELEELLDLRPRENRCQKARALLDRVLELGDRRCLPFLTELDMARGCGSDGGADCYPCVRDTDLLARARAAASAREAPTPWILRGR